MQRNLLLMANGLSARSGIAQTTNVERRTQRHYGLLTSFIVIFSCLVISIDAQELDTSIQLEPDLNIVVAIRQGDVDFEGLRIVDTVNDASVILRLSWSETEDTGAIKFNSVSRMLRREDLASSNRMIASFHMAEPELLPGSTAIQTSTAVLNSLAAGSETPIVFGIALGPPNDFLAARKYYRGSVRMVGKERFPLLLDGERTSVPVIHATGTLAVGKQSGEAEFWWLDQPDNPLTLRWSFLGDTVQVVRIDRPHARPKVPAGPTAEACRAELHGIYFDTASATLLPASDAALQRVADLLAEHADWIVTIEGHTDSIGGDTENQDLSERRAAAVRTALIQRFNVAQDRLTAKGFGETRPVETNETLEGRARNRRVELAHNCPP